MIGRAFRLEMDGGVAVVTFLAGLQAAAHVGEGARRATRSSGPEHRRQDPA